MADLQALERFEREQDAVLAELRTRQLENLTDNVGLSSVDGTLVWGGAVDDFHLAFRKIKRIVNVAFHFGLVLLSALTLISFSMLLMGREALSDVYTSDFWLSGHPSIALFWIGLFLDCYILFRLIEYSQDTKIIPGWGKPSTWHAAHSAAKDQRHGHRFDVSPYVTDDAWQAIGSAYTLSRNLKHAEVLIPDLFAAALASDTGSRFLTRIGLPFERTKEPIARLLRQGAPGTGSPTLSKQVKRVLIMAYEVARVERRKHARLIEIFLECFRQDERLQEVFNELGYPPDHVIHVAEWIRLREKLREDHERFIRLASQKPKSAMNRSMTARATPLLDRFSEDLTVAARNGYVQPIVGRDQEMRELLRAIESGRRSVVLVGPRGVGKKALVEGLARRMVEEDVPQELFDKRLVSINIPQVVAAGDAGMASERFFEIVNEVAASGNIILVLDGIEALSGGGAGGPLDLAEGLSTQLDRGSFIVIGMTTPDNYTKYIERRSLGAKLIRVDVPEMQPNAAIRVLMARVGGIEYKNKIFFTFAAIDKAVSLSGRYIHERALPSKALDVVREAAVSVRNARGEGALVGAEDIAAIIHEKTHIPVESVTRDESQKLLSLEEHLHGRVIGQHDAVTAVAQAMRRARAELREGKRPIANFLFLGSTGVGKTETAKALAQEYFGADSNMIRADMSEYQDQSSIHRMIGAPGDERGGLLTEAVRKQPFAIVLLDEIEKAHPDILNLFLQVMDDGRLTDGVGRTIDFTNTVVIMTSNAGTSFIQEQVKAGANMDVVKTQLIERELKGMFRPEFLNRFDAIIVFKPLTLDDVEQITWLMLRRIEHQLEEKGIRFRAEDAAVGVIAQAGFDPAFGARPLRRVIQDRIENQLADILLRGQVERRDTIVLAADGVLRVEKAAPIV